MFDLGKLAIIIIETPGDKHLIPSVLDDIRTSLFSQEPMFVVVSGSGKHNDLTVALNSGIDAAIAAGCEYVFWAHPDMKFSQPNWHIPLIKVLEEKSSVLKVCASNSRDPIGPLRIDQEQSWMMRVSDLRDYENLKFHTAFKRIGGFEDWYQSWQIIGSGMLVLVIPDSQVFHAGMGTRKLRDTVEEQQGNSGVYHSLTSTHENPHQWKFFGNLLTVSQRKKAFKQVVKQFPEFKQYESLILWQK